jgi:hypothetical protein
VSEFNLIIKPDAEEEGAAEIFVDGNLGGHPYQFLLDTGAGQSAVIFDDYTAAFDSSEKRDSSGVFAKSSEDLITVPSIGFGPIAKQNFTLVRKPQRHPDTRNLIGMDVLKDFRLHFFFDANRVSVDAPDETEYAWQALFLDGRFHPYVGVGFGGATARSVWDTGASLTIVDTNFVEKYPTYFQEIGQSSGTDSTGATMETPMYIMAETKIGGHRFPPHKVAGVDLSGVNDSIEVPMDLILGYTTLSQANWLFDFPDKRWTISKHWGIR